MECLFFNFAQTRLKLTFDPSNGYTAQKRKGKKSKQKMCFDKRM